MIKCTLTYCKQSCIISPPREQQSLAIKYAFNPVLSSQECKNNFGSIWHENNLYHLFYADFSDIYHSASKDGLKWLAGTKVLCGRENEWDEGLEVSLVFKEGASWYILYRGHNRKTIPSHGIGLAYMDNYKRIQHRSDNPIIGPSKNKKEWDGAYIGENVPTVIDPWGIIKVEGIYYLWFNCDNPKTCRSTGLVLSKNLIDWEKDRNNPIFKNGRFCVCPFRYGDYYYMVVVAGGYQRRHNWFELYRSRFPTFYENDREYLGILLNCGCYGDFDYGYIDCPSILTNNIQRIVPEGQEIRLYYTGERNVGNWSHGLATFNIEDLRK